MKKHALAGAIALAFIASPARADDTASPWGDRFIPLPNATRAAIVEPLANATHGLIVAPARASIADQIARAVSAQLGRAWVSTALRLAKIESGFRCNARNGRAVGLFQNTRPEDFGVSRRVALTCAGGIAAGIGHMRRCVALGARDFATMARCHNSGSPWGRVDRVYRVALRGA